LFGIFRLEIGDNVLRRGLLGNDGVQRQRRRPRLRRVSGSLCHAIADADENVSAGNVALVEAGVVVAVLVDGLDVALEVVLARETLSAKIANERPLARVSADMLGVVFPVKLNAFFVRKKNR
jgi:hypothetical protein